MKRALAVGFAVYVLGLVAGAARPTTSPREPPPAPAGHGGGVTRCKLCHVTTTWREGAFDHDRTGYRLEGAHGGAPCRGCHTGAFEDPVPTTCAGCHQDVHRGSLGQRCDGCHDPSSWDAAFDAFAHRRTAFPLTGRHAFLPCAECHPGTAGKAFSGATVPCASCHARDWSRAALTSVDHAALGFSTDCRSCHDAWGFERGRFPGHDACFELSGGPHARIACLDCHTTLRGAGGGGTCSTNTASCTGCHEHACGEMDDEHQGVPGYQCRDRKCYECHRFSTAPAGRAR